MKINAAMIARNESAHIEKSLKAAVPYVDDIILVDTGSTDDTVLIAKKVSDRIQVYHFDWVDDFSAARNFSLEMSEKTGADYTLVLDADEYLRKPASDPRTFIEQNAQKYGNIWAGYLIRYDQFYNSDNQIDVAECRTTRLIPSGTRYSGRIHEQPVLDGVRLVTPFVADHDGYLDKSKGARNLGYLEKAMGEHPDDPYLYYQMGVAYKSIQETEKAVKYFSGFYEMISPLPGAFGTDYVSDGVIRYLYALTDMNTADSLAKALQIVEATEKYYEKNTDYWFFCGIFFMKLVLSDTKKYIDYLPRIEQSYLRCLEIGESDDAMTVKGTGSFKAWHNLGLWYRLNGDEKKAEICFKNEGDTHVLHSD